MKEQSWLSFRRKKKQVFHISDYHTGKLVLSMSWHNIRFSQHTKKKNKNKPNTNICYKTYQVQNSWFFY